MLRILVATTLVATQIAFATASDEFNRAAAQAAEKSKTSAGAQYPLKVAFSISHQVVEAMEDCRPDFPLGSTFDFVLIVSASGRIERVLPGPISPYGKCISSRLRLPQTVAKPPSDSWPVQIRLLHGQPTQEQKLSSIPLITDSGSASTEKAKPASSAYSAKVMEIEQRYVIAGLQKDVKRWEKNTIRVNYEIDPSGQIHNLRIFCKQPNPWAEETIRRALSRVKFPSVPAEVLNEVHSDRVDIEDVIISK